MITFIEHHLCAELYSKHFPSSGMNEMGLVRQTEWHREGASASRQTTWVSTIRSTCQLCDPRQVTYLVFSFLKLNK